MNIKIDLEEFFNDHRKYSLLYINLEEKIFINEVIEYICEIFDIGLDGKETYSLFVDGIYIPGKQSSLVLKNVKDVLKLKRGFSATKNDTPNVSENTGTHVHVQKKKHKTKKSQEITQIQSSPDNKSSYGAIPFNYNDITETFPNVNENRKADNYITKQISDGELLHTVKHKKHKKRRISYENDSFSLIDPISKDIRPSGNYSCQEILSQNEERAIIICDSSKDHISADSRSKKKKKNDKEKNRDKERNIMDVDVEVDDVAHEECQISARLEAECDVPKSNMKGQSKHSSKLDSNCNITDTRNKKRNKPFSPSDSCDIVIENEVINLESISKDLENFDLTSINPLKSDLDLSLTLSLPHIKKKRKRKHSKKKHKQLDYNEFSKPKVSETPFVNLKLNTNVDIEDKRKHIKFGSDIEDNSQSLGNLQESCQTIQDSQNLAFQNEVNCSSHDGEIYHRAKSCVDPPTPVPNFQILGNLDNACATNQTSQNLSFQKEVNSGSHDGEIYYPVKSSKGPPTPVLYEKSVNTDLFAHLLILENSKNVSVFKRKVHKETDVPQEQSTSLSHNKVMPSQTQYTPRGPPSPKDLDYKTDANIPQSLQQYKKLSESKYTPTYYRKKDSGKPKLNNGLHLEEESSLGLPTSFSSSKFKIEDKSISHSNLSLVDKRMEENSCLLSSNQEENGSIVNNNTENNEDQNKDGISFMGIRPKKFKEKKMYSSIGSAIKSLKLSQQNGLPTDIFSVSESSHQSNSADNKKGNYNDLFIAESEATQGNSKERSSLVIQTLKSENLSLNSSTVSDSEKASCMDKFYLTCPLLTSLPNAGDTIAAKVMTIDKTFCPCFSDYQPAKVVSVAGLTLSLQYFDQSEITPEKIREDMLSSAVNDLPIKKVDWRDLKDTRIILPL